ncbi:UNVERIFIED_CONTAM: hypothetical protein PYX00_000473 [Menopon gallinae]|uniref:Uncharacterized protein n=1 Tax=Menopon gallinae TaxID=328185 RepID=A0AAW2IA60_9NEOP
MKYLLSSVLLLSLVCVNLAEQYTTKYDNVDVDAILKNERLLKNYVDCVLDRGRCTKEGQELRKRIPDAIATDCAKCSAKQKEMAGKIMAHLLQYKRNYWNEILEKYDTNGEFRKKYEYEE